METFDNRERLASHAGCADVADIIGCILFVSTDIFVSCSCTCMCKGPSHQDHAHQRVSILSLHHHRSFVLLSSSRSASSSDVVGQSSKRLGSKTRSARARGTLISTSPTSNAFIAHRSCLSSCNRDSCHCVWAQPSRNHNPHSSHSSSAQLQ
jgi:hypothetical protein